MVLKSANEFIKLSLIRSFCLSLY